MPLNETIAEMEWSAGVWLVNRLICEETLIKIDFGINWNKYKLLG